MRVIYDETNDCTDCLYNERRTCKKLGRYLFDICYEHDCPLPHRTDVENFTRYITRNKSLFACGNCKYWKRWDYNKHLKTELGVCTLKKTGLLSVACNSKACNDFKEV